MEEAKKETKPDPCDELLRVCAAEIGISIESVGTSAYRNDLLAILERAAVEKIRNATEGPRRVQEAYERRRAEEHLIQRSQGAGQKVRLVNAQNPGY